MKNDHDRDQGFNKPLNEADNQVWAQEVLGQCLDKIEKNIDRIGEHFPHVAYEDTYNDQGPRFWVSGFWLGLLWLLYEERQDTRAFELARKLEDDLDAVLDGFMTIHHDVGFMWLPSAVADYKLTKNEASRVRGLKAASHLAGRFNLAGRFIRAWSDGTQEDRRGWVIIDCLMNLSLLFWASRETEDPRFRHIAMAHADTVLKNFVRPDNTCAHIVHFDPETGEKIENLGGQGKDPDSAWSRGQAWAIYGFAIAYRETKKEEYLTASRNIAGYFLSHLPEDKVPYWDFRTEPEDRYVRDSSAAACAASGLLELSKLVTESSEQRFYREQAIDILKGLYEHYFDMRQDNEAMLLKGTVSYAARKHVNVSIIYGDYFFTEALIKLSREPAIF